MPRPRSAVIAAASPSCLSTPPANRQDSRSVGAAKTRRLQMALRQQLAPLRVSQLLQAIIAHGPASPFARAMGSPGRSPPTPATTAQGPYLMGPDSVASRQRSDRQMGAMTDGPGEGEPPGCQSRPSRESWLRPSRTSTSSTSRNATSSSIGVIGPLLRVVQRSALDRFAPPRRCSPSGVADQLGRPVDRYRTLPLSRPSHAVLPIKCYYRSGARAPRWLLPRPTARP